MRTFLVQSSARCANWVTMCSGLKRTSRGKPITCFLHYGSVIKRLASEAKVANLGTDESRIRDLRREDLELLLS